MESVSCFLNHRFAAVPTLFSMLASLTFVELKQYLGGHRFKTYNDAKKRGGGSEERDIDVCGQEPLSHATETSKHHAHTSFKRMGGGGNNSRILRPRH